MKLNTMLAALALSVGAVPALAQGAGPFFGGLTEAERIELAEERFAVADADGDGQLTQDEVIAAQEEAERLRRQERAARMIEALDADGNGTLSLEETQVARAEGGRFMDHSGRHRGGRAHH